MMTHYFRLQARLLVIVAMSFFIGCQQTDKQKLGIQATDAGLSKDKPALALDKSPTIKELGLEGIKPPPLPENYQEIVKQYQAITGSEVREIIDSITPKEVLVGILDPDTKREMPIPACFAAPEEQELMFVPATLLEESALILQAYYNERPDSDKVQIISVSELEDWVVLLQKAGPGIAGDKHFNLSRLEDLGTYKKPAERDKKPAVAYYEDGGINYFFDNDRYQDSSSLKWERLCCREWMHRAVDNIPPQDDEWSCGINAAAKAINMFNNYIMDEDYYLNTFLANAPKSIDRNTSHEKGGKVGAAGVGLMTGGILLAPFTLGTSLVLVGAGAGMAAGGTATQEIGKLEVGPKPRVLAKYITNSLQGSPGAVYHSYNDFGACAKHIRDDLKNGEPVIVLWIFAAMSAHYVTVVGVSLDNNDLPEKFIIMDTDNILYEVSSQDMETLMERRFASFRLFATTKDNYHMVRFYR